jgi:hypothetical protein
MAFGQPSGPPATARQLRDLTALVEAAGHTGFRDARGPLGLTQRQAAGRFTRDEAVALIARLEADQDDEGTTDAPPPARPTAARASSRPPSATAPTGAAARPTRLADQLRRVPEELLASELRRRGWVLIPPTLPPSLDDGDEGAPDPPTDRAPAD